MRSYTEAGAPGRCQRCWVRDGFCICAKVPPLSPRTRLLCVRHLRESYKSTGTVRIAQLALPKMALLDFSDDAQVTQTALEAVDLSKAWLLFPPEPGVPARTPGPGELETLVVLDGTWRQTRKMLKKLPALEQLPRLDLPPKLAPPIRLRESPSEDSRSTLEAIGDALRVLEGDVVGDALDGLHATYVEAVLRARGVWELKGGV